MPFCTSCGKEAEPGKKFCEYCGAPLEQPAAPAAPPPVPATPLPDIPRPAPQAPPGGHGKTMVVAGIVVVILIIAGVYVFGLPLIGGPAGTVPAGGQSTPLPTQTPAAYPTAYLVDTTQVPVITAVPEAGHTYEERYMETYNQVYSINQAFVGGQKAVYDQELTNPPLYIKFNITPKMFYDERPVEIGTHQEHIENISYPSPNSWFRVRVLDAGSGDLVEEQGFNKEHSVMTKQEFMVRAPGSYRVEMSGNDVTAEIRILIGKS